MVSDGEDISEAKKIIDESITKMPIDYYGYYTMVEPFAGEYYKLGEKEKADGRWLMVWGVIALFVMVSVWGLVNTIVATLDLNNTPVENIVIPKAS